MPLRVSKLPLCFAFCLSLAAGCDTSSDFDANFVAGDDPVDFLATNIGAGTYNESYGTPACTIVVGRTTKGNGLFIVNTAAGNRSVVVDGTCKMAASHTRAVRRQHATDASGPWPAEKLRQACRQD